MKLFNFGKKVKDEMDCKAAETEIIEIPESDDDKEKKTKKKHGKKVLLAGALLFAAGLAFSILYKGGEVSEVDEEPEDDTIDDIEEAPFESGEETETE